MVTFMKYELPPLSVLAVLPELQKSLAKKQLRLELSIEDNGVGLLLDDISSGASVNIGLGLSSMKERVELTAGTFTINSVAGQGTVVHLSPGAW